MDPSILFLDQWLLVVDKPAGLASVPGKGVAAHDHLLGRVRRQQPDARIVHRLDMDTSGLMVLALDARTQAALGAQFERRQVDKVYTGLVADGPPTDEGVVDLPLCADWPRRPLQMVDHQRGKPARTAWRVLTRGRGIARVLLFPVTGRSHQLRVHMAALGCPLIGDPFYGGRPAERLMLHATRLQLQHPLTEMPMTFISPPPF